jgi:hypothetical protein
MSRRLKFTPRQLAIAATLAGFGAAAQANLVANGSFETGDFTGWSIRTITTCCSFFSPTVTNTVAATDGSFSAGLDNGFALLWVEQTLSTVAAQRYRVSFDLGILSSSSPNSRQDLLTVRDGGGDLVLTETLLSNNVFTSAVAPDYKSYAFEFDATGSSTTIRFATDGYTPFASSFLDKVSVTAVSAIPEPAAAWLAAAGLGVIALVRRRRAAA